MLRAKPAIETAQSREIFQTTRFGGSIPLYEPSLFARIVAPLVWLKTYINELKTAVLRTIWDELFRNETEHDEITHLLAFLVFSGFALVAHIGGVEDYLVFFVYAIWPLDQLLGKLKGRAA